MRRSHRDGVHRRIAAKDHIENTEECCQALSAVFSNLDKPAAFIAKATQLEQNGDKLTAEAYHALEALPFAEIHPSMEQFIQRLDDITDGINNTARLIDICLPTAIETAAQDIHGILLSMIDKLRVEIAGYPDNQLAGAALAASHSKPMKNRRTRFTTNGGKRSAASKGFPWWTKPTGLKSWAFWNKPPMPLITRGCCSNALPATGCDKANATDYPRAIR